MRYPEICSCVSKLIGGYIVFVCPVFGVVPVRLVLACFRKGFPLGESDIFLRVLSLTLVSLLYIGVFFAIGTLNFHLFRQFQDSTHRRFHCLGTRRVDRAHALGFLTAKFIATGTRDSERLYGKKPAINNNLNEEKGPSGCSKNNGFRGY